MRGWASDAEPIAVTSGAPRGGSIIAIARSGIAAAGSKPA
jgi:hypothetical protein